LEFGCFTWRLQVATRNTGRLIFVPVPAAVVGSCSSAPVGSSAATGSPTLLAPGHCANDSAA
jgi:hypothetical protein